MTSIDSIVRSALMSNRLTIHYYVDAMHYALKCLREIEFDTIGTIYTDKFTVDAYNEFALPDGFIDWVRVGVTNGPYIVPLGEQPSMNRNENTDSSNNVIAYQSPAAYLNYGLDGFTWAGTVNYYGEPTGGYFGGSGTDSDTFKIIRERNTVRVGSNLSPGDEVYMEYIADGPAKPTSLVHPYTEATIESYVKWCMSKFGRIGNEDRSRYEYYTERKKLRGRVNGLTKEELLRLSRNNRVQAPK